MNYLQTLGLLNAVFEQFKISTHNYQTEHKRMDFKPMSYKSGQKILQGIKKCRYLVNSLHSEYEYYEQLEEKRKESHKKNCISSRVLNRAKTAGGPNDNVFSRLTRPKKDPYDSEGNEEYPNEFINEHRRNYEENINNIEGNMETTTGMNKFIDKCLHKILPKKESAIELIKMRNNKKSRKILEIDRKENNEQMLARSIHILKQSVFNDDPQIRGYVGCLIKELQKDYEKSIEQKTSHKYY